MTSYPPSATTARSETGRPVISGAFAYPVGPVTERTAPPRRSGSGGSRLRGRAPLRDALLDGKSQIRARRAPVVAAEFSFLTLPHPSRPPTQRFTEKAIKVVMLAQEEARRLGHNFVGTEQVRGRAPRPSLRTAVAMTSD